MKIYRYLSRVLEISGAIAAGEPVSEYSIAWAYADLMLPELLKAMKKGMPRTDAITALATATQVKRSVAADVMCKKLKRAGYKASNPAESEERDEEQDETPTPAKKPKKRSPSASKAKTRTEVSAGEPPPVASKPDPVPAPVAQEVPPAHTDFKISAPAELARKPAESTEQKPFRVGIRVGPANFAGVDDMMTEQQQEEIRQSHKALDALEAKYGTAREQADRIKEQ